MYFSSAGQASSFDISQPTFRVQSIQPNLYSHLPIRGNYMPRFYQNQSVNSPVVRETSLPISVFGLIQCLKQLELYNVDCQRTERLV
jgi:hypothetical protein